MLIEALIAAFAVAATSVVGALFFGNTGKLIGLQRYVVPAAVGVFLSLVLFELIPETLESAPTYGGLAVALGFVAFYVLSNILHQKFHAAGEADCDRKGAAVLLLIGDAVHNVADGVILGGAFLVDPALGVATAIGLALHEIPQEIVEFGVLVRAGYSRLKAALLNLISAGSILVGTGLVLIVAEHGHEYLWVVTGFAAGNLLFLAASDLLPRIHGNLKNYGTVWHSASAILIGFLLMSVVLDWTHREFGHGHAHGEHGAEVHEKHGEHDEDHHDHDDHGHAH